MEIAGGDDPHALIESHLNSPRAPGRDHDGLLPAGADADFAAAAIEATRLWQFSPVRRNGVPQECRIQVTVQFQSGRDF